MGPTHYSHANVEGVGLEVKLFLPAPKSYFLVNLLLKSTLPLRHSLSAHCSLLFVSV